MKMAEIDAGLRKWKVYIEKKKKEILEDSPQSLYRLYYWRIMRGETCPDCGFKFTVNVGSKSLAPYCWTCYHKSHCGPKCTFGRCEERRKKNE